MCSNIRAAWRSRAIGLARPLPARSRAAVDGLKYGVSPRCCPAPTQAADQACTEIADHIAEEVLHHKHVKARWIERELHAEGVNANLFERQERVVVRHLARNSEKHSVALR